MLCVRIFIHAELLPLRRAICSGFSPDSRWAVGGLGTGAYCFCRAEAQSDPHNRSYEPLSDSLFAHHNTIRARPSKRGSRYHRRCYGGGVMAGAFDASGSLSGVVIMWGTLKAGYSAAAIASIIAAVRGSVQIITYVR